MHADEKTPMERVEQLYAELVEHYGGGERSELRAAAKILLVAFAKFREHGGPQWQSLLDEYVDVLKTDPGRFERIIDSNRASSSDELIA